MGVVGGVLGCMGRGGGSSAEPEADHVGDGKAAGARAEADGLKSHGGWVAKVGCDRSCDRGSGGCHQFALDAVAVDRDVTHFIEL